MNRTSFTTLLAGVFVAIGVSGVAATEMKPDDTGQEYVIRSGDTLGTISEHFYEDPFAYPTIMDATNEKAKKDKRYKAINSPHAISPGQILWIPVIVTKEAEDMEGGGAHKAAHWGYQGEDGPTHWGGLDKKFAACDDGREQSPISIPSKSPTTSSGLKFNYNPTGLHVLNNGHTVQVNYDKGSTISIDGHAYELAQFHFHVPSEHTVDGVHAAMEMHMVHVDKDGGLAVVGLMFDIGKNDNPFLAQFWSVLPPAGHELNLGSTTNVSSAFDLDGPKYRYAGSLTTPPCSEKVKWYVATERAQVSKSQLSKFVFLVGLNARPTQPLNSRSVGK